jgi:hypothetical protein
MRKMIKSLDRDGGKVPTRAEYKKRTEAIVPNG